MCLDVVGRPVVLFFLMFFQFFPIRIVIFCFVNIKEVLGVFFGTVSVDRRV